MMVDVGWVFFALVLGVFIGALAVIHAADDD
jgi:hypothetical protein